jgi:dipeptidyl aminopeptidase/acylaminoacyl peptidase
MRFNSLVKSFIPGLAVASVASALLAQQSISGLKTVAESSDYQATSRSSEVVEFVDVCATVPHIQRFDFGTTVEGKPMVAAVVASPMVESLDARDDRLRILLLGNIHSGECAGKEALLAILRELAGNPLHPWLNKAVLVIAPDYNADANDRVGLGHRPGQNGPAAGMGVRENAMQLDLNRDFMKLESPEARALVGLVNRFDPHMFIDCHTTNGSEHQYKLTYDIPHNPTAPQEVRDYLRNRMMPAVTERLRQNGTLTFYYGNFSRDNQRWETYGHEPRYSTEYLGLRGRLGILSEAYSYATYAERIAATDAFVRQCVEHVCGNSEVVRKLLEDSRQADILAGKTTPEHLLVHLQSNMVAFPGTFSIAGFRDNQPFDYDVAFVGDFSPTVTVSAPFCYLLPPELSLQAARLQMHGIQLETMTAAKALDVTIYTPRLIRRANFPFQGHNMVTVEANKRTEKVNIPAGTIVVRTGQPLARLITYMLEPESNDGLVTWNFLDAFLSETSDYPILRVDRPSEIMTDPLLKVLPGGKLQLAGIFGPDRIEVPDSSLGDVTWLPDGKSYVQEKNGRRIVVDAASGAESRALAALDSDRLVAAFAPFDGITRREVTEMLRAELQLRGDKQRLFVVTRERRTFVFDAVSGTVSEIGSAEAPAELFDIDASGTQVAWVQSGNLFVKSGGDEPVAVSSDGSETVFNGKLDWVYQEELYGRGNFRAFWWSPDGKSIAWLRTDESPVNKYTVTDHLPVLGRFEVTAYPKAGDPLPVVSLHIYDLSSRESRTFGGAESDSRPLGELLYSRVTWDRTSQSLLVRVQNRTQTWLDLYRHDPVTGTSVLLFRESTPAWIESPGDPLVLEDGSFLWMSTRSGCNAIYHYAQDGTEIAQLTVEPWEVRSLEGCDFAKRRVYFTGSPDSPLRVVPMFVSLDGGTANRLIDEAGCQAIRFNRDLSLFLCETGDAVTPDSIKLFDSAGHALRTVVANRNDWLAELAVKSPEFVTIPAGSGDGAGVMDAMIIKPANFDENRRWPVVVHIYGGPQTPRVHDKFGGDIYLWHQYLAQQGFVVMVVDVRPSSYRAVKQTWPIYRNFAARELEDLEAAMTWLKGHPWVDGERLGLWGWSYGGYMTAFTMTHSRTFAAGIAGAPVTDWRNYDAIYTERYMSTPQDNPDGYAASSVVAAAGNLNGKLLLVHGTIDDNVHISNTMQLVHALQKAGKQFELMVYPESRHSVRDPQQKLHLYQLMTDFFRDNLKPVK